jgi:adenosylcobinamide-GDP ribazoletransferase
MDGFLRAIGLLTILEFPAGRRTKIHDLAGVARFFPFVGLLMGLALFLIGRTGVLFWSRHTVSIMVVIAWFVFTGREHLAGVSTAAEALVGAADRETRLALLKSHTHGSFGLLLPMVLFLLKFSLLGDVEIPHIFSILLSTPMLSRAILVPTLLVHPSARQEGMVFRVKRSMVRLDLLMALVGAGLIALLIGGPWGLVAAAAAALISLGLGLLFTRLLGGLTDETSAVQLEVCELALLAFFTAGQTLLFYPLVGLAI